MRPSISQVWKLLFLVIQAPLILGSSASANDDPSLTPSSVPNSTPLVECQCAGPRYAHAVRSYEQGKQLASAGDARCVDRFFSSASLCWEDLTEGLSQEPPRLRHGSLQLYNTAVLSGVVAGHRLGRLDANQGLRVFLNDNWQTIPIIGNAFAWRMDQIDCFRPVPPHFKNPTFAKTVRYGLGAALLGIHYRRKAIAGEHRYLEQHPLPITAVFQPAQSTPANPSGWVLEFYNPVKYQMLPVQGQELMLSRNIAAAVEFAMDRLQTNDNPLQIFFNPQIAVNHEGLLQFQPYQPNKIPLVLVHGLLANPATWGTIINELLHEPELMERYQIWAFMYPTSVPFLKTAADFRYDLQSTLCFLDPTGKDPALQNMVLIGHSMGGLLARLQVVWSGNMLWNEFAKVPFAAIQGNSDAKQLLSNVFFFEPQSFVKRVVFIAVPHKGSSLSVRMIGCLGRILAGQLPEVAELWAQVYDDNPRAFRAGISKRLPSSVAGLAPGSPAIRGLAKLPFASGVPLHSIIGTGGCKPCFPGDGVVAIKSARLAGVESEIFVDATHTSIKEKPQTFNQIKRILWLHWSEATPRLPPPKPEPLIPTPIPNP